MDTTYENITCGDVDFSASRTRENLMRAFAGECQAAARYSFAAEVAHQAEQEAIARVFAHTCRQELAHARVFYSLLESCKGQGIHADASWPVTMPAELAGLLRGAQELERYEAVEIYPAFGYAAREEGFDLIAWQFEHIAGIEHRHEIRFQRLRELLEGGGLVQSDGETDWICINCGYTVHAGAAPRECPVCRHGQGFLVPVYGLDLFGPVLGLDPA